MKFSQWFTRVSTQVPTDGIVPEWYRMSLYQMIVKDLVLVAFNNTVSDSPTVSLANRTAHLRSRNAPHQYKYQQIMEQVTDENRMIGSVAVRQRMESNAELNELSSELSRSHFSVCSRSVFLKARYKPKPEILI
jgi:hypothetical protein